jgi:hypothetical protein
MGSEETLEISGGFNQAVDPHAAATVRIPPAPLTAIEEQSSRGRSTREHEAEGKPSKPTNVLLVAGVSAIVVLLLVLVGIGIALLLRGKSEVNGNVATETNANANKKSENQTTDPSANANATSKQRRPDMTGEFSSQAARVEAKILRGASVNQGDIAGLSRPELRRLRNTVYARHGRIFERMELQQYFDGRPWYQKRADYSDDELTPVDRDNINLIRAAEDRSM